jgi:hypothetical protein
MIEITAGEYHMKCEENSSVCINSRSPNAHNMRNSATARSTAKTGTAAARGSRSGGMGPPDTKGNPMNFHPGIKPALWGAAAGAVVISMIGFSSMGWMLGSTAERLAADRAESAVVGVLTPICVEKFQQQTDSATKLIEFKKAASWDQRALIEKGGWATTPGTMKMNSAVASACAEKLGRTS